MTRTIEQIDQEIEIEREKLKNVKGKPASVYARIVGYFRSLDGWNIGKEAEYHARKAFTKVGSEKINKEK